MRFEIDERVPNETRVKLQHFLLVNNVPQEVGTTGQVATIIMPGSMLIKDFATFISDKFRVKHIPGSDRVCLTPMQANTWRKRR